MGFFRFLKKDKNLDLPPAPPIDLPSLETEFPTLPEKSLGELPDLEKQFPPLPEVPPAPISSELASEDLPEPPKIEDFPPLEAVPPKIEEPLPEQKLEQPLPLRKGAEEPLYIEVNTYREILEEINSIKNSIKAANNALQRLSDLKDSREKELEKWRSSMENLQRKLSFIDKNLFEGA